MLSHYKALFIYKLMQFGNGSSCMDAVAVFQINVCLMFFCLEIHDFGNHDRFFSIFRIENNWFVTAYFKDVDRRLNG